MERETGFEPATLCLGSTPVGCQLIRAQIQYLRCSCGVNAVISALAGGSRPGLSLASTLPGAGR